MKKLIWPIVGLIVMSVLTTVQEAMADRTISAQEWVLVGLQAIMAFNVWATANLPGYERMKTYVAAVIVVAGFMHTAIIGGFDTPEIINMVILGLSALGVAITPQSVTTVIDGQVIQPQERDARNV
jgi:hypothetical protein